MSSNLNIKEGRCTRGLAIPKSNWANKIDMHHLKDSLLLAALHSHKVVLSTNHFV
ncbi:hypothetical protein [Lysinibacillus telephonicus]|uniref:hypothetical protein n=1 Tax=Lysinibacillus telephonicus TaxID=1714840 RepID=UPI0016399025|nr:hypothetical protein [Lysinibacillus telephonicus]